MQQFYMRSRVQSFKRQSYNQSIVLDFASSLDSKSRIVLKVPSKKSSVQFIHRREVFEEEGEKQELIRSKIIQKLHEKRFRIKKVLTEGSAPSRDKLRYKKFDKLEQISQEPESPKEDSHSERVNLQRQKFYRKRIKHSTRQIKLPQLKAFNSALLVEEKPRENKTELQSVPKKIEKSDRSRENVSKTKPLIPVKEKAPKLEEWMGKNNEISAWTIKNWA